MYGPGRTFARSGSRKNAAGRRESHHFIQRRTQVGRLEQPVAAGARRERVGRRGARTVRTARARGRAAQRWVPGLERRPQLLATLR